MQVFHRRQFLNAESEGGTAFVEADVQASDDYVEATFKVADCNRIVELIFYGNNGNPNSTSNARQKIVKLRRAVVAFEKSLIAELDTLDKAEQK